MISIAHDCEPMLSTLFGMVIEVIPLPLNAPASIVVAPLGSVILVILLQPLNAPLAIIFAEELSAILLFAGGHTKSLVKLAL